MSEILSGIYSIINDLNGHQYIGSSIDIYRRFKEHKYYLHNGKHHSTYLQNAWDKYGENSFSFNILKVVERKENLIAIEQEFLSRLQPEYNIFKICCNSPQGTKHSKEHCQKISDTLKGHKHSEESKKKMSFSHRGEKLSEEHTRKIVISKIGKHPSDNTKNKIKESQLKYYANGGKARNKRAVARFSKGGVYISQYDSLADAGRNTNIQYNSISMCASGKIKSAGGYIWKYIG